MKSRKHSLAWFLLFATIFGGIQTTSFAASTKFNKCFTGASLPGIVGRIKGPFRVADSGIKGVLTYGPYVSLQPGSYVADITYSIPGNSKSILAVIDWAAQGKQIAGTSTALLTKTSGLGKFTSSLKLSKPLSAVEVRVYDMGVVQIQIQNLCIRQTS